VAASRRAARRAPIPATHPERSGASGTGRGRWRSSHAARHPAQPGSGQQTPRRRVTGRSRSTAGPPASDPGRQGNQHGNSWAEAPPVAAMALNQTRHHATAPPGAATTQSGHRQGRRRQHQRDAPTPYNGTFSWARVHANRGPATERLHLQAVSASTLGCGPQFGRLLAVTRNFLMAAVSAGGLSAVAAGRQDGSAAGPPRFRLAWDRSHRPMSGPIATAAAARTIHRAACAGR
jgi:hypothetical protein